MSPAADPTDGPRPLVDSSAAAEALRTCPQQLHKWTDTGIVSPARVDDDGARWWNLHDLRRSSPPTSTSTPPKTYGDDRSMALDTALHRPTTP